MNRQLVYKPLICLHTLIWTFISFPNQHKINNDSHKNLLFEFNMYFFYFPSCSCQLNNCRVFRLRQVSHSPTISVHTKKGTYTLFSAFLFLNEAYFPSLCVYYWILCSYCVYLVSCYPTVTLQTLINMLQQHSIINWFLQECWIRLLLCLHLLALITRIFEIYDS